MPLVEIVQSARTDPRRAQAALAFARKLDKLPLPCRSAPGFLVNRVLMPYLHEAMFAAQEGVPLAVIDRGGGGLRHADGTDRARRRRRARCRQHVGEIIAARAAGGPARPHAAAASSSPRRKLGRKSGAGFYDWQDGKAVKPPVAGVSAAGGSHRSADPRAGQRVRRLLREGVVDDADLVDAGVIFGTGFAPFRGGPLAYARSRGVDDVVARLEELAARYGARFQPDPGWYGSTCREKRDRRSRSDQSRCATIARSLQRSNVR